MSEHKNPYRAGSYHQLFGFMMTKRIFTIQDLVNFETGVEKLEESKAWFNVNVLNSPRKSTTRKGCSCMGNLSARGDLHYSEKIKRVTKNGVKEAQRFMLRWRNPVLPRAKRVEKIEVASVKTATPAKVEVKAEGKQVVKA